MKKKLYLHSIHPCNRNLEFEILKFDKETRMGVIRGEFQPFKTNLSKEALLKSGWRVDDFSIKKEHA